MAVDINKVFIAGRLTKDPEKRALPNGTEVASFSIANNRKWKDSQGQQREDTLFLDVEFFGKQAGVVAQHFKKGSQIFVEGRLKLDQWEKDGQRREKLRLTGESFQFLDPKAKDGSAQPSQRQSAPAEQHVPTDDEMPF